MSIITEQLRIQDEARSLLIAVPKLKGYRPECHAARLRVHLDFTSYTLFSRREDGKASGLVRIWQRDADEGQFPEDIESTQYPAGLEPTIETSQVELPLDRLDEVLDAAARLSVPVRIADPATGADGTEFFLAFADSAFASARFMWWQPSWMDSEGETQTGSPQPGWEELARLVDSIIGLTTGDSR